MFCVTSPVLSQATSAFSDPPSTKIKKKKKKKKKEKYAYAVHPDKADKALLDEPARRKLLQERLVCVLLAAGASVHSQDRCGRTVMHYAVGHAHRYLVMILR